MFKRRTDKTDTVSVFFATDLHGSEICWRKFLAAAGFYKADVLVLGGDFTGKLVIPIVPTGPDRFRARHMGKDHEFASADIQAFERKVADSGFYTARVDGERMVELEGDRSKVDVLFEELMTSRLISWIDAARKKFDGTGVRILTAPANDDPFFIDDVIEEHGGDVFVNVENKVVEIAPGHEMISTGYTNRTPWDTPREYDEHVIGSHIEQMVSRLSRVESSIFNFHPPPKGTKLDPAPRLNERLEVVTSMGATVMDHVGSQAVLEALERHQPLLSLHGHIHESAGQTQIGRTLAVNPGSEYGEGVLKGALLRIGGGRIHSYQATSG